MNLQKSINNWFVEKTLERRLGGMWREDERDYLAHQKISANQILSPEENIKIGTVGTFGTHIGNQGMVSTCTCWGVKYILEIMLGILLRKKITIPIENILYPQQARRNSQYDKWDIKKNGDTLRNAMLSVVENGVIFNNYDVKTGDHKYEKVFIEGFARIDQDDNKKRLKYYDIAEAITEWHEKGHPVYTGAQIYGKMIDDDGYLLTKGKLRGGHQFNVSGSSTGMKKLSNSWGEHWGNDGFFHIENSTLKNLFGFYVFYGLRIEKV